MKIVDIVSSFDIADFVTNYYPLGNGHINTTYLIYTKSEKKYVLQKINSGVFKDIDLLMNNVFEVTEYLRDRGFESLHAIKTKDGALYLKDEDSFYRLYDYIEDTVCYEKSWYWMCGKGFCQQPVKRRRII